MAIIRANFAWYDAMIKGLVSLSSFLDSIATDNYIEIYSGTMPVDANDWLGPGAGSPGGGSPTRQLLATFSNFKISTHLTPSTAPSLDVQEAVFTSDFAPDPGTVNASATGTAAWYAMYDLSRWTTFGALIGDVTLSGGNGSMHLDSLDVVSGQPVQLLHWGMRFQA